MCAGLGSLHYAGEGRFDAVATDELVERATVPSPDRPFQLESALRRGVSVEELSDRAWALKTELPNPLDVLMGG